MAGQRTWRQIAEEVAAQIESGALLPGAQVASEEDLAARMGVSRHTAHRAMHELQRQGLVIRQRRWGTIVAEPKPVEEKRQIAYLMDFSANRFQAEVMTHIEHALEDGNRLVVATSRNDPEREAEHLTKLRNEVDGIVCYPCDGDTNAQAFLELAESGYPLVLVDRAPRGCEDFVVLSNNTEASRQAVGELVARGHRRIAFFGNNDDRALSNRERYLGYRAAVDPLGYATRPYERRLPVDLGGNSESMMQSIADAFTAMQTLPEPPTAAFCVQDWLAVGLIEACAAHGIEVGSEFAVATYNDFGPTFFRQPWRLDRVVQHMESVSAVAVERLKSQIKGDRPARGPVRVAADFFPAELVDDHLLSPIGAAPGAVLYQ